MIKDDVVGLPREGVGIGDGRLSPALQFGIRYGWSKQNETEINGE
jgi:hypothetical protein